MDVTIANLHISVHLADQQQQHREPGLSRVERETNRAQLAARVEQEREQVRNWLALHGTH